MEIKEYLKHHTIIWIGRSLPGYVCCEAIVDHPEGLIDIVRKNNCFISEIRWWERAEITKGASIGYGGSRDPRAPDSHFFSETDLCKKFDPSSRDDEYLDYLKEIKSHNPTLELFPAFDIKKK